jgi:hypothetical protein
MHRPRPRIPTRRAISIKIDMPHSIELYSDGWPPIGAMGDGARIREPAPCGSCLVRAAA